MKIFENFFKKNKIKKLIFIISGIVFLFGIAIVAVILKNKDSEFNIKNSRKNIGIVKTLEGEKDDVEYDFKFPYFKYKEIDAVVNSTLQKELSSYIKKAKKENLKSPEIKSDYNSFSFDNRYGVSIEMRFLKKSKKNKEQTVKTLVFDHGKKIQAKNIFKEDNIKKTIFSIKNELRNDKHYEKIIKKENINLDSKLKPEMNTLNNFIVKDDYIEFFFNPGSVLPEKYGILSVNVPNTALKESFSRFYYKINPKEAKLKGDDLEKSKKPLVALTFDDGPYAETTPTILNELEKNDAQATFFVCGNKAEKNKELLKRELENGHEIANHTYSHPTLTHLPKEKIEQQVEKTNSIVEDATGFRPKLVRAPGGSINSKVKSTVKYPLIYWTVDTRDWETKNTQNTIKKVLKEACDGAIILMHDTQPSTAEAVKTIIPELINRGFCLVTVSDMFRLKNLSLEKGIQYDKAESKN